ncbi:hypothetical protein ACFOHH_01095 [Shinella pollutisoli]|uniref:Uncharacterized protein n=1 Tax=Shinella pollutisoli TaxID=2250594 RepID=A0ABV7D9W7_9HYPH
MITRAENPKKIAIALPIAGGAFRSLRVRREPLCHCATGAVFSRWPGDNQYPVMLNPP